MDSPGLSNEYCTQKDKIAFCRWLYPVYLVYLRYNIYYNFQIKIVFVAATTGALQILAICAIQSLVCALTLETSKYNILLYSTPVLSLK